MVFIVTPDSFEIEAIAILTTIIMTFIKVPITTTAYFTDKAFGSVNWFESIMLEFISSIIVLHFSILKTIIQFNLRANSGIFMMPIMQVLFLLFPQLEIYKTTVTESRYEFGHFIIVKNYFAMYPALQYQAD